jgi:hypothetical protein
MRVRRLLTQGGNDEPLWVKLYVTQRGDKWAAMICADEEAAPQPDQLKGLAFFGDTAEEAEQQALTSVGVPGG